MAITKTRIVATIIQAVSPELIVATSSAIPIWENPINKRPIRPVKLNFENNFVMSVS